MFYTQFDPTKPTTAQTRQAAITSILNNNNAARDIGVVSVAPGFNYSRAGGTALQPAQEFFKKSAEWFKLDLTWGTTGGASGNVTVTTYSYSSDSGATYVSMGTETRTYDASANLTATTWS